MDISTWPFPVFSFLFYFEKGHDSPFSSSFDYFPLYLCSPKGTQGRSLMHGEENV